MVSTQVVIGFTKNAHADEESLDALADAVLDALNRDARLLAFGPVVSADYTDSSIICECTVCTETGDDTEVQAKMDKIGEIMRDALIATEYETSAERIAVPA